MFQPTKLLSSAMKEAWQISLRSSGVANNGMLGNTRIGLTDIYEGLRAYRLAALLGWMDVKMRYRRSTLGPFWLTISTGVMIAAMALVFGQILNQPLSEFLPFICVGIILWGFIAAMLTEGCMSFIGADAIIKELPIPLFCHVLRVFFRSVLILLHNLLILPVVLLACGTPVSMVTLLLSIVGFAVVSLNLLWMALLTSVLCTRYRDMPPMIANIVQIGFYLTPIIWPPELLRNHAVLIIDLNPFAHILAVVRAPLLGQMPTMLNWFAAVAIAIVGWTLTVVFYGRYKRRIAYWL
jgi:ABC-type polysaccharide/polyol phosphate export permease